MTVKYIIVPSPFESGKFFVRTITDSTYTLEEAITDITQETALTESEIRGAAAALARRRDEALLAGRRVDYGELGRYTLRIRATLDRADALLPPDYEVDVAASLPRQSVTRLAGRVTTEREQVSVYQPLIHSFFDAATKQKDAVYTAGASARISGVFLRFDEADAEQGVFFVALDGTAVRATVYLYVGSTKVTFDAPQGLTGPQMVVLRARRREGTALLTSDPIGPLDAA
jgi:hypothetical protein